MQRSIEMVPQTRMSPLTALFLGLAAVGVTGIAATSGVVLYGMRIVDGQAGKVMTLVSKTIGDLPEIIGDLPQIIDSLPPIVADAFNDRRMLEYAPNLKTKVRFVASERSGRIRPVVTITNEGDEVLSMLTLRVVALNERGLPIGEWTEVVATPIGIDGEWRGPLSPGATRHVMLGDYHNGPSVPTDSVTGELEITEIRAWVPPSARVAEQSTGA